MTENEKSFITGLRKLTIVTGVAIVHCECGNNLKIIDTGENSLPKNQVIIETEDENWPLYDN